MKVYQFPRGGISFEDKTAPQRGESVLAFLPGIAVVPLVAQNGIRSLPVVAVGESVREGQLIARRQGAGSANIHSPVPGKILENLTWSIAYGVLCNSMIIRMEGSFSMLGKPEQNYSYDGFSPYELREIISEFGLVDMDGTGNPISDILSLYHNATLPATLVVRCVFDDPWLVADYVLLSERLDACAEGAIIAARASCASQIVVAVSAPERELGEELVEAIAAKDEIPVSIVLVSSLYPQRNGRELNIVLRQCERKEKRDFGSYLCFGPATLSAIFDAVTLHRPPIERYVAVGGSAVKNPSVLRARLGIRISQLFDECGGFETRPKRTVVGSPLLGRPVFSLDEPLTASNYAVFAIGDEGSGIYNTNPRIFDLRNNNRLADGGKKTSSAASPFKHGYAASLRCIGCGDCRTVCPMGLDPEDIFKMISTNTPSAGLEELSSRCHGCGCCEVVCPSRLPLSRLIINPSLAYGET